MHNREDVTIASMTVGMLHRAGQYDKDDKSITYLGIDTRFFEFIGDIRQPEKMLRVEVPHAQGVDEAAWWIVGQMFMAQRHLTRYLFSAETQQFERAVIGTYRGRRLDITISDMRSAFSAETMARLAKEGSQEFDQVCTLASRRTRRSESHQWAKKYLGERGYTCEAHDGKHPHTRILWPDGTTREIRFPNSRSDGARGHKNFQGDIKRAVRDYEAP